MSAKSNTSKKVKEKLCLAAVDSKKLDESLKIKLCLAKVNSLLEKPLNYLKPKQIDGTYAGVDNDLLCVLPTGYGKTVLFNTIPVYSKLLRGWQRTTVTIVISPLNAIIAQQKLMFGDKAIVLSGILNHITYCTSFLFEREIAVNLTNTY